MSSLALLMQQHQQGQDSTCEKDSGIDVSCPHNRFESTQKNTQYHRHHHHHKAPPRQYSSSSTDDDENGDDDYDDDSPELQQDITGMDETEPPTCSSYSDHYLVAIHPCSPKSAPTWNWMHNRRRGTDSSGTAIKRATKPFGGITKNSHIATSIEALNRQYHQQIYLGTSDTTPINSYLEDEGDFSCSRHHQEEKTSPEFKNARPPEAEAPEETMFELEM